MPRIELPHIIHKNLSWESALKAIQENFDALSGEVPSIEVEYRQFSEDIAAVKEEAAQEVSAGNEDLITQLNEAGVGPEDGAPPTTAPTNVQILGIAGAFLQVTFDTIANNSPVYYDVYVNDDSVTVVHPTNFIGTFANPGGSQKAGVVTIPEFPAGHGLAGQVPGTQNFWAAVVPRDGAGDGPSSTVVGPVSLPKVDAVDILAPLTIDSTIIEDDAVTTPKLTALAVTAEKIASNAITTDKLNANSVTAAKIAALTITASQIAALTITGSKIAGSTITADKMSVGTLSAITANLGTVNAGSITGITITGGTVRTASSGQRVELTSASQDRIRFYNASNVISGYITGHDVGFGGLELTAVAQLILDGTSVDTTPGTSIGIGTDAAAGSGLGSDNFLELNGSGGGIGTPGSGRCRIYYNNVSQNLGAVNASGVAKIIVSWP